MVARDRVAEGLPLAPNEERYVLAEALTPHVYAVPWSVRIKGHIDASRLQEAIQCVCNRHDALRTGFERQRDGSFTKYVDAAASVELEVVDAPGASDDDVAQLLHARFFRQPDLSAASLKAFVLVRLGADEQVFGLNQHHSITDGQSIWMFVRETFDTYSGNPPSGEPPAFRSVLEGWRESPRYAESLAWWVDKLAGVDVGPGIVEDRASRDEPSEQSSIEVAFTAAEIADTEAAAARLGVTAFEFYYAASVIALSRVLGTRQVVTTFQSNGRRGLADHAATLGPFSNALILVTDVEPQTSFVALARKLRVDIRIAIDHELAPLHQVIRATGVHPRNGINWFPKMPELLVPGLVFGPADVSDQQSDYDLNMRFVRAGDTFKLLIFHCAQRVSASRMLALASTVRGLAKAFASDPEQPIGAVPSVRFAAPGELPDLRAPLDEGATRRISDAFVAAATADPERTAIESDGAKFSYGALLARSAEIAGLLNRGNRPARVAIIAERSPALVATMLGCARAGVTFVLLDSAYPASRLATLIEIARPETLLAAGNETAFALAGQLAADARLPLLDSRDSAPVDAAVLDRADPDQPAYFLFTSGSTGRPKCVAVAHRPLAHFAEWQARQFAIGPDDRVTMLSGLGHDPLMRDVFTTLSAGATLLIPSQSTLFEPGALRQWFARQRPTIAHMTPPLGRLLAAPATGAPLLSGLRRIFFGGDLLPPDLLVDIDRISPGTRYTNFYGSTETPQAAGWCDWDGDTGWRHVPVGRGSDGFQLAIVDDARQPLGIGEVGEIAVRSRLLCLGYVEDGRIVPRADSGGHSDIYYTGDRGLHLPGGDILALGRNDDQIKVRGYRVDLAEITAELLRHPKVHAAVTLATGEADARRIEAFVVADVAESDHRSGLSAWLAERLPSYMVPYSIRHLEQLPLLPNGKLDRKALLSLPPSKYKSVDLRGAESETEAELINAWQEHLGDDTISPEQSFAELRGDSMSYVQVFLATEKIVGTLPDDWQTMKLADLAVLDNHQVAGWWKLIDSAMLVRAVAIILVVALHLKLFSIGGGATSALLMVSGFLIGKLQLPEVERTRSSRPLWRLIGRVLVPAGTYTTLFFLIKLALDKPVSLSILLFYADFIDYRSKAQVIANGEAFFLWYISAFVHIMVALGLIAWLALKVSDHRFDGRRFIAWVFVATLPLKFVLPGLLDASIFQHGIPPLSVYGYLPTSHLSTLALGVCLAGAQTRRERLGWLAVAVGYSAATYFYVPGNSFVIMMLVALMLLFVRRLPVPSGLHVAIFYLSGASLFIYLTHLQTAQLFEAMGVDFQSWLLLPLTLVSGVAIWLLWQKLSPMARRLSPL